MYISNSVHVFSSINTEEELSMRVSRQPQVPTAISGSACLEMQSFLHRMEAAIKCSGLRRSENQKCCPTYKGERDL